MEILDKLKKKMKKISGRVMEVETGCRNDYVYFRVNSSNFKLSYEDANHPFVDFETSSGIWVSLGYNVYLSNRCVDLAGQEVDDSDERIDAGEASEEDFRWEITGIYLLSSLSKLTSGSDLSFVDDPYSEEARIIDALTETAERYDFTLIINGQTIGADARKSISFWN